jgi:uncharacterized membrane protein YbhN (UPF0104 family)
LVLLAKYGLGLGLLALVIAWNWHDPSPDGSEDLGLSGVLKGPIHLVPLALAVGVFLAGLLITFIRWYLLVRAQGLPFTLPSAIRLGLVGSYFNSFLPGSIGGDIIKAACIAREQSRRTVAVATVMIDRAMGLCGLFWLVTLLGGFFWAGGYLQDFVTQPQDQAALKTIILGASALTAASLVFWLLLGILPTRRAEIFANRLLGIPRVGHSLSEFWRAMWMYRCQGRTIAIALGMSMLAHVGFVLTFYFAALTLASPGDIPSWGAHFLLVPVGMIIQAGIPTPGGVGGGEAVYGFLYKLLSSRPALGVKGSMVQRMVGWVVGLVGYLVYLRMRPTLRVTAPETAEKRVLAQPDLVVASEQA